MDLNIGKTGEFIDEAGKKLSETKSAAEGFIGNAGSKVSNAANMAGEFFDSAGLKASETASAAADKLADFHANYVSKVVPQEGVYGDVANFTLEMIPGVSEYNSARQGDWKQFAVDCGIDGAAIGIAAGTAGLGTGAAIGVKAGLRAGIKKGSKAAAEVGEKGIKKLAKEGVGDAAEAGAKKAGKETGESAPESLARIKNQGLEGKKHPQTGVPFEKQKYYDDIGNPKEAVVPKFESKFNAELPKGMEKASDKVHFTECNKQLKEAVDANPRKYNNFTEMQLEQIKNGHTPDGYTWHHALPNGKMELVDSAVHQKTGHTAGYRLWGSGGN